jgi:hypothetical protein
MKALIYSSRGWNTAGMPHDDDDDTDDVDLLSIKMCLTNFRAADAPFHFVF